MFASRGFGRSTHTPLKPDELECVIHGAARGADSLAGLWAKQRGVPEWAFPAQWDIFGKAAGPMRNKQMLDEGKPTHVLAFPGGSGTRHMVSIALSAGIWTYQDPG